MALAFNLSVLEWSCVLIEKHVCFGQIKKVRRVHDLLSASHSCKVDGFVWRKTAYQESLCCRPEIYLIPVAFGGLEAGILS